MCLILSLSHAITWSLKILPYGNRCLEDSDLTKTRAFCISWRMNLKLAKSIAKPRPLNTSQTSRVLATCLRQPRQCITDLQYEDDLGAQTGRPKGFFSGGNSCAAPFAQGRKIGPAPPLNVGSGMSWGYVLLKNGLQHVGQKFDRC